LKIYCRCYPVVLSVRYFSMCQLILKTLYKVRLSGTNRRALNLCPGLYSQTSSL
jgi:hypothetical protein